MYRIATPGRPQKSVGDYYLFPAVLFLFVGETCGLPRANTVRPYHVSGEIFVISPLRTSRFFVVAFNFLMRTGLCVGSFFMTTFSFPAFGKMQFTVRGLFLGCGFCDRLGDLLGYLIGRRFSGRIFRFRHVFGGGICCVLGFCGAVLTACGRRWYARYQTKHENQYQKRQKDLLHVSHAFCLRMRSQATAAYLQYPRPQRSCIRSARQARAGDQVFRWWVALW